MLPSLDQRSSNAIRATGRERLAGCHRIANGPCHCVVVNAATPLASGRRGRRVLSALLASAAVIVGIVMGAWLIDSLTRGERVVGEVSLAGRSVDSLDSENLGAILDDLESSALDRPVTIRVAGESTSATVGDLGVRLDRPSTESALTAASGGTTFGPIDWLATRFSSSEVEPRWIVDNEANEAALSGLAEAVAVSPVEPTIEATGAAVSLVPGTEGQRLDAEPIRDALLNLVADGRTSNRIEVAPEIIPPRLDDDSVEALADEMTELTKGDLEVRVGSTTDLVPARHFRVAARLVDEPDVEIVLDDATVRSRLAARFADEADPGIAARFEVVEAPPAPVAPATDEVLGASTTRESTAPSTSGATTTTLPAEPTQEVRIVPSTDGTACCAGPVGELIAAALRSDDRSAELEWIPVPPAHDTEWAESLGIVELVGEFTTNHAPGQNRVHNIHTMADTVRGSVILPGEMFSLNEAAGRRTTEAGYKSDGVIYDGEFTRDVGGGVSQFSTTLFNAAFFAGLEYGEYQSHSRYISRYPYGRETTLSWPAPDLQIINPTPDGILIWPEYTDRSITVKLFGTQWAVGEQTGRWRGLGGGWCRVTTERTRTFVTQGDRTETDTVQADYRDRC